MRPFASYSPWRVDQSFQKLYKVIFAYTLVDWYRCYELWQLVEQTAELEGALIEVGVWRGGTGALIAHKAISCGINDPVYLCDTFEGVVKASSQDSTYKGGEHADTTEGTVIGLLNHLQLSNVKILKGIFPDQVEHLVTDQKFRFCHIDVDVYASAKGVVDWIWDRMAVGGIMVYDDYGFWSCDGITNFVDEQRKLKDRVVIHNLNGHAVVIKLF